MTGCIPKSLAREGMPIRDFSDEGLMEELQQGNDGALSELMLRWQQPLAAFVFRYLQNPTDTSEVVQETFVRIYQSRQRYRPTAKFSTWIFTIAANLCRNRARWRRRHPSIPLEFPGREGEEDINLLDAVPDDKGAAPFQAVEEQERASAVKAAIAELPHELKTALILSHYEHMAHAEIAAIAGCTPKAVETRVYRARQLLKKSLAWLLRDESAEKISVPDRDA